MSVGKCPLEIMYFLEIGSTIERVDKLCSD